MQPLSGGDTSQLATPFYKMMRDASGEANNVCVAKQIMDASRKKWYVIVAMYAFPSQPTSESPPPTNYSITLVLPNQQHGVCWLPIDRAQRGFSAEGEIISEQRS
jgi:hypothetical protein